MSLFSNSWLRNLIFASASALSLQGADDPIDKVGKLASEWVRTRSETVRLETEWAGQQQMLEAMINAVEERVKITETNLEEIKGKTAQERAELDTLEAKNKVAEKNLAQLDERLKATIKGLMDLKPSLPPRLQVALDLPYKSLSNPDLAVGDRVQHTVTILNRCVQFNRIVTSGEDVLTMPGESGPKSLEVVYWGLSHGYALDRAAGKAWLGAPGSSGWQWEPRPEAAAQVSRLISMATDRGDPEFVIVPAKLQHLTR